MVGGSETERRFGQPTQSPLAPLRSRRWAAFLTTNLDWITYLSIFFLVGIPVYYAKGYAMPLHLTITILAYFTAMMLPPQWRQYLHPVLVSALLTVLTTWVFALTRGQDLHAALTEYRTGLKYLQLWQGTTNSNNQQLLPGAGDVFGTVLDASIVSLALPMYQHRRELRSHFAAIVVPNVVLAAGSLFAYPPACRAAGIGAERALAFAARSLTLALAIPATDNLGGDANTVAAVAIMSGIVGALVGQRMLAMLKIPEGKDFPPRYDRVIQACSRASRVCLSWLWPRRRLRHPRSDTWGKLIRHCNGSPAQDRSPRRCPIESFHEFVRHGYRSTHVYPTDTRSGPLFSRALKNAGGRIESEYGCACLVVLPSYSRALGC